jgi:plastocyanin
VSDDQSLLSRRNALKCMAYGGAGTLFALSGGVFTPIDLAMASDKKCGAAKIGRPLFVQISDTHIGFNKDANPDVNGTLAETIELVNGMPEQPALIIHTGDITHLSKAAEFDTAQQLFSRMKAGEMHTVPGEHDTTDATVSEYFDRFGKASDNKGYYSFDHAGVHFVGLINVLQFKPGGSGYLGAEQLAWVASDLKARSASTPQNARHYQRVDGQTSGGPVARGHDDCPRLGCNVKLQPGTHVKFKAIGSPLLALAMMGIWAVSEAAAPNSIEVKNFMFTPTTLTVNVGARVSWVNKDDEPHTVVSDTGLFRSGALDTDESFSFKFDKPGTYHFTCSIHPRMVGTIIVK